MTNGEHARHSSFVIRHFHAMNGAMQTKPPEPDTAFEISLRPPMFSEFTGQGKVRERLELMVQAAKQRGDVLEHILLRGTHRLGKTRLD